MVQGTDHEIQPITFNPLSNMQLTKFNQINSYPMDVNAGGGIYPFPYPAMETPPRIVPGQNKPGMQVKLRILIFLKKTIYLSGPTLGGRK